jgi:hypothetical protein
VEKPRDGYWIRGSGGTSDCHIHVSCGISQELQPSKEEYERILKIRWVDRHPKSGHPLPHYKASKLSAHLQLLEERPWYLNPDGSDVLEQPSDEWIRRNMMPDDFFSGFSQAIVI